MDTRPRIGITVDVGKTDKDSQDYSDAVARAGGQVVFLYATRDPAKAEAATARLDGFLVPGGADLDPQLYGQAKHEKTKLLSAERMAFDLGMLKAAQERKLPTLGICLGCQMMNVHRRGTLHQHLPDAPRPAAAAPLLHSRAGDRSNSHDVAIRPGTVLRGILGQESIPANSRHHQAIDKLGHGVIDSAAAPDGIIEAIEDPTLPFWLAVQWHPENLGGTPHERLFAALVAAAETYRAGRSRAD